MDISKILRPIEEDLEAFIRVLDQFVDTVPYEHVKENYRIFFRKRGKYLRPSLLFFSYYSANPKLKATEELYRLALILELIHSASLIHDDIIDQDEYRRGEKTVHSVFGNKVGVLAGDTLFTYAFMLASKYYPKEFAVKITDLAYKMCMSELRQANAVESKEDYLTVIEGKTAYFMETCMELGALIGHNEASTVENLSRFGLNLGMVYQIIDDFEDHDVNALAYIHKSEAKIYYDLALKSLENINESPYKTSLVGLLNWVMKE